MSVGWGIAKQRPVVPRACGIERRGYSPFHFVGFSRNQYSDCWKVQFCLEDEGFQHLSVNLSISFVDRRTATTRILRSMTGVKLGQLYHGLVFERRTQLDVKLNFNSSKNSQFRRSGFITSSATALYPLSYQVSSVSQVSYQHFFLGFCQVRLIIVQQNSQVPTNSS